MSYEAPEQGNLVSQLLPKTLAGLAMWILMIAVGVAVSGVAFFALYQYRINTLEQEVNSFSERFEKDFDQRTKEFNALVKDSKAEIEKAAEGAGSQSNQVQRLLEKVGPSIAYISGTGADGAPASGSGFVVTSNSKESWVMTSFRIVAGSAAAKSPVRIRLGKADREATVWTWDERRDLALVILNTGNQPVLEWEKADPPIGSPVWAIGTGLGRFQAAASQGFLIDNARDGMLTDAAVAVSSSGGPLLSSAGKVIGVLSTSYAPEGFPASQGWAVPIRLSCQKVLRCPS